MFLIHNTLGEDSKIFHIDENPTPAGLYKRIQQNPDEMEKESTYTKLLREFYEYKEKYPELVNALNKFPSRIKVAKNYTENELLVFFKKGRMYINGKKTSVDEKTDIIYYTIEDVYEKIKCEIDEKGFEWNETSWDKYEEIKNFKSKESSASPERSLENQALINLKSIISKPWDDIMKYLDFIRILRNDIIDYGTLSDFTHRRLSNLKYTNENDKKNTVAEIKEIYNELGDDYLDREISNQKQLSKEVIIAVENREII